MNIRQVDATGLAEHIRHGIERSNKDPDFLVGYMTALADELCQDGFTPWIKTVDGDTVYLGHAIPEHDDGGCSDESCECFAAGVDHYKQVVNLFLKGE